MTAESARAADTAVAAPPLRQFVIAGVVALVAAAVVAFLVATRERVESVPSNPAIPTVEVVTVTSGSVPISIPSQGRLEPSARVELTAQLAARVVALSPNFQDGASVQQGDVLFELERTDFELSLAEARARAAEAEAALAIESGLAATALEEWKLVGRGEPNELARREPQLAQARARVEVARAHVARAELDLTRTRVVAPFAGRINRRALELGQYVTPGRAVAELIGDSRFEVRLSIASADRPHLPTAQDLEALDGSGGPGHVTLTLVGGRSEVIEGRLVRTAAEVDPRSQTLEVIAVVDSDPAIAPDLLVGAFVHAHIEGRALESGFVLPRSALRGADRVLVVGADSRVFLREVTVLRRTSETVVVGSGLREGERVVVTPLLIAADGMAVDIVERDLHSERANEVR